MCASCWQVLLVAVLGAIWFVELFIELSIISCPLSHLPMCLLHVCEGVRVRACMCVCVHAAVCF